MSYAVDVYRRHIPAEKNFLRYMLYVTFFPQLVAGPIERAPNLLPQFYRPCGFDYERMTEGLKLMLWGLFKKVVIADRLAIYVNQVYGNPADYHGAPLILATYFFAFQVYCDFSGYTDIAIGGARVLGFNLMENFNRPFFAKSIPEFWQRWHISLSTWFKDYLYIPLGGSRVAPGRWRLNLFLVFVASGFWHGANWTFILWGALHGFYVLCSIATRDLRQRLTAFLRLDQAPTIQKCLRVLITFHLFVFSLIFFRANSLADAWLVVRRVLEFRPAQLFSFAPLGLSPQFGRYHMALALLSIFLLEVTHLLQRRGDLIPVLAQRPTGVRWAVYYALMFGIIFFGVLEANQFIYFQF